MFRASLAAAAAAFVVLGASGAAAATTITSTFDTGSDGWRFGAYDNSARQDVTYDATTGSITKTHGLAGWGFVAPTAYLGDMSDYLGGSFDFELSANRRSYDERSLVVLKGAGNQRIFSRWDGLPGSSLAPFSVQLTAANFYVGSIGNVVGPVSEDLFAAIMADLEFVMVMGDWSSGVDTVRLDNVAMRAADVTAVPEPATWALLIGGFGMAGTALRARRRLQAA
ncbi:MULTISPECIES: PEPxxWA-CTERM sorting domain-containing protein [unclassified Phenylobacterium]|uniref:PEPxxWA-CTERM sorting domain-containing protein n=1 Tax=unclassified Phenylobacterium TaxID=2640670 RepID=UPI00083A203D|nr:MULTISPECIES: PEPxxWA-CTERM sorting domain-containing protein [unclassified Phenylobacterium]